MLPKDPNKIEAYLKKQSENAKRNYREGKLNTPEANKKRGKSLKRFYANGGKNAMTGKIPWNKGLTKETDERVKKYSSSLKETLKSEECRKVKSDNTKIQWQDKEFREFMVENILTDRLVSKETKDKISKAHIGKKLSDEHKKKISKAQKGKIVTEETKEKMGKAQKGRIIPDKQKKQISETLKEGYASGRIKIVPNIISKDTKPELEVKKILEDNNIEYVPQWFINNSSTIKFYDFYLPDYNLLVEVDGIFWHGKGIKDEELKYECQKKSRKSDKIKTEIAKDKGFNLIRIWEDEIDNFKELVINKFSNVEDLYI